MKPAPSSICAETSAIAKMFSDKEAEIETIVAVNIFEGEFSVISPCGQCRQLMSTFGDPYIIIDINSESKKAKLSYINLYQYKSEPPR